MIFEVLIAHPPGNAHRRLSGGDVKSELLLIPSGALLLMPLDYERKVRLFITALNWRLLTKWGGGVTRAL